ncbi:MAG: OmpA family protein, partial [Eudoraea sp.]|nr:OmpA family protein [Eudoraea sp.]
MNRRILLLVIILFSFGADVVAQERIVTKGNIKYQNYSFSPAIDIYQKVLDKGYMTQDLLQKLGNAYYFNADYQKAAATYKILIENYEKEVGPEYYFRYSQCTRSLGDYQNADDLMVKFAEMTGGEDNRAATFKSEKEYLAEIAKNSGRYDIAPFEYNTPYSEFAPSLYKQGLLFSSDRDTGNLARYRHTWNSKDFLDLFKVNTDSASNNVVTKMGKINSRMHESTSITTKDGNTLYFTRNNFINDKYKRDEDGVVRLKIFRATLVNGVWENLEELPFNNDSYSVAHPALSPDEETLYFASDMPGAIGGSDIYKIAINDDGSFGTPINLGGTINTEARETFPYVTSEEILYFSSDGHPGLGGLDVFATKIADNYEGKIINVGEPVNSKWDDFTFVFAEETRKGYFASNRAGGMGSDDIYSFLETKPLVFECVQQISGTVRDKISNELLVGSTVKVIDENNEEILSTITDSDGNFNLTLDCNQGNFVRAMMQGYVPAEEYLTRSDGKPRVMDFYLEREKVTAGFGDDLAKLLQLSTIYFDFDKYNIRPDAEVEIQKVIAAMEKYPSLKIKANSHTDSRGRDSYNLWLSQKRAESTVNYMISKGIAADRLSKEGFGETRLVNQCEDGVRCSK